MALYRDEISIVSLKSVRSQFTPRIWKRLTSMRLTHGNQVAVVKLERAAGSGVVSERVWMLCPRCSRRCSSVAFSYDGIGCRRCVAWRSRNHYVPVGTTRAPHLQGVVASEPCRP